MLNNPERTGAMPLELELYPAIGFRHPKHGSWRLNLQGRIFRHSRISLGKRLLLKALQHELRKSGESATSDLFMSRVDGFLVSPEAGARLFVEIGGIGFRLRRRSKTSGLIFGKLDLPENFFRKSGLQDLAHGSFVDVTCRVINHESVETTGQVLLAHPRGVSVISDIDDTIKHTVVTNRKEMLAQTFLRPFEPVDGIAEVYREWSQNGALFHYVSSSPWQIYSPLHGFLQQSGFPNGSMHLRWFRLRDEMFKRWSMLRRKSKGRLISSLIRRMPDRKYVLVGDSGERDPEIYAKVAQRHGARVSTILIRDLDEHPMDPTRIRRVQSRIGMTPLVLFREAKEIREVLDEIQA